MRRRLPKFCSEFRDRHGKIRVRFRRTGYPSYYFKAVAWTPEFMAEYQACLSGKPLPLEPPGASRSKPGTFSALIAEYYASPEFLGLAPSSRVTYRGIIERFRAEHGEKRVASVQRQHIKAIIGSKADTPAAANNLLDRLVALLAFAVDSGYRRDNPARGIKGFRKATPGFHTWTEDEIARYQQRHPDGRAALALALLLYTGQRRSDVVRMGPAHIVGTDLSVVQQKTGAHLVIPIHPELARVLAPLPPDAPTFLMTSFGKSFTAAGFGNWFRERCNEAGLTHCTAHGLRKAAARRIAEAGCSHAQIKAITGHKTDKEVATYIAAADQVRLARQAYDILYRRQGRQSAE